MKTFLFCLVVEIVTAFSNYRYNPYNGWIVQQHQIPLYSYNQRINVIGTDNLSDQRNNIGVAKTNNNIGISGTGNEDNKKIFIKDVHLNFGRNTSNIDNKIKTQKEENNINTNLNVHKGYGMLNNWNQLSNSAGYEGGSKSTWNGNYYIPHIPKYSSGYYTQYNQEQNQPINSYNENTRRGYNSVGQIEDNSEKTEEKTSVSNKYIESNHKSQEGNTNSNTYQKHDSYWNAGGQSNTNKYANEDNKISQNITGIINVEGDSNQSSSTPANEDNKGYYIEKSDINTDNTETEDDSKSLVDSKTTNKKTPCLLSSSLIKPIEIIKTNKIEIREKETLYDTKLSGDVNNDIKEISIGRKEHCIQKCLHIYS